MTPLVLLLLVSGADPVKFGPLSAAPPASWKSEKPANRLRSHQFALASGEENVPDAQVFVMPESSAKTDKEFPRWKAQFTPPDGKTLDDVSKESKWEVGPATIHLLDVSGTWKYKERPFDPKSKEEVKPEYRAVWAVVVQKDEATHVRLSYVRGLSGVT